MRRADDEENDLDEFCLMIDGVIVEEDSVRVCLTDVTGDGICVLRFGRGQPRSACIESSVMDEELNKSLESLLVEHCEKGARLIELFSVANEWREKVVLKSSSILRSREAAVAEKEDEDKATEEEEEEGEYSEEIADLKDSRTGLPVMHVVASSLADECARVLGDNLLLYSGFEEVPLSERSKVFAYLIKSRSLSSKKLKSLVGPDLKRLDLSGMCHDLIHGQYLPIIAVCQNLTKLNLNGCINIEQSSWDNVTFEKLEDISVANTQVSDSFVSRLPPSIVSANFSRCMGIHVGIGYFVSRCNRLRTLNISHCKKIPWHACVALFGLFWPCFESLNAEESGDMTGTTESPHRSVTKNCMCNECKLVATHPFEIASLQNAACNGIEYNLRNCRWVLNVVLPESAKFPHLRKCVFGTNRCFRDVWKFVIAAPRLENLDLDLDIPGQLMQGNLWKLPHPPDYLKNVAISNVPYVEPLFLLSMPNLEVLSLKNITGFKFEHIALVVRKIEKLNCLTLESFESVGAVELGISAKKLEYLKLAQIAELYLPHVLNVFETDTLVVRGIFKGPNVMDFLNGKVKHITLDSQPGVEHPFDGLHAQSTFSSCAFLGYKLGDLFSNIVGGAETCRFLVVLDISTAYRKNKDIYGVERKEQVLECMASRFVCLKTFALKHQAKEGLTWPSSWNSLRTVQICGSDFLSIKSGATFRIQKSTCKNCNHQ